MAEPDRNMTLLSSGTCYENLNLRSHNYLSIYVIKILFNQFKELAIDQPIPIKSHSKLKTKSYTYLIFRWSCGCEIDYEQ